MRGQRQQIDVLLNHVNPKMPNGLHSVGMEQNIMPAANLANLGNRLNRANLIISVHDANQRGFVRNRALKLINPEDSIVVNVQISNRKTLFFKSLNSVQNRMMLEFRGDNMIFTLFQHSTSHAFNCPIVGLGATRSKIYFARRCAKARSNGSPSLFHCLFCRLANRINTRRVAKMRFQKRQHSVQYRCRDRRGCGVVNIYNFLHRGHLHKN